MKFFKDLDSRNTFLKNIHKKKIEQVSKRNIFQVMNKSGITKSSEIQFNKGNTTKFFFNF